MPKKILSVLSHTEYGNLEDSDIGLFASAYAPAVGGQVSILLSDDAVNYAVRGQDGTGITIAGGTVQPGFLIEQDVQSVQGAGMAVYAFKDDLDERGITDAELVPGIKMVRRGEFGKFVDQFDTVWNW